MTEMLRINNFDEGIATSPHKGIALIRNADISAFGGGVSSRMKPTSIFASFSGTASAQTNTDIIVTDSANDYITGTAVTFTTTGSLPTGISAGTVYYAIYQSAFQFRIATTLAAAIAGAPYQDITDSGTGQLSVAVVTPGTINYIVKDPTSTTVFLQDSNGRVWYYNIVNMESKACIVDGGLYTSANNASGSGLCVFKNSDASKTYLFVFRNHDIDVKEITTATTIRNGTWNTAWMAMKAGIGEVNTLRPHYAILAQDNIVYYVDGRYIGSIMEKAGQVFDPANPATYTQNDNALDVPPVETLSWLEEVDVKLIASSMTSNKIYPWDRRSDSFDLPISVPENAIYRMKNLGGTTYILAGTLGNIYTLQGTGSWARFYMKIPDYITNPSGSIQNNPLAWGGIAQLNGSLLFGASVQSTGNSGLYKIDTQGALTLQAVPSTGSGRVTAISSDNEFYTFGYSGGADGFGGSSTRYTNYEVVVQSAMYVVADKTTKAQYSTLEVQLGKASSGDHIRVSYRGDLNSSWTTIGTFTTDGGSSYETDAGLTNIENIQIQVEMDGFIDLFEVRLIP